MRPIDYKKLEELRELANIPTNSGEQFIDVYLNVVWGGSGHIDFGFNYKMNLGTYDFSSLDQAISIVKELRKNVK